MEIHGGGAGLCYRERRASWTRRDCYGAQLGFLFYNSPFSAHVISYTNEEFTVIVQHAIYMAVSMKLTYTSY